MPNNPSAAEFSAGCLVAAAKARLDAGEPPRKVLLYVLSRVVARNPAGRGLTEAAVEEHAARSLAGLEAILREKGVPCVTDQFALGFAWGYGITLAGGR